jgi:hypothetical protein
MPDGCHPAGTGILDDFGDLSAMPIIRLCAVPAEQVVTIRHRQFSILYGIS